MKVTFIGHASILIETSGIRILSDPWWRGPCFGAQWWLYPMPALKPVEERPIDYIYISHGHHDHFHPGTLRTFPKATKVLVSREIDIATPIRELGFEVIEVSPGEVLRIENSPIEIRIMPTHGLDTLMALTDGREVCVNLNDSLHSAPESTQDDFIGRLRSLYGRIAYVFCGYGVASHFPNCYRIPNKDNVSTAIQRQRHFNRQWARIIAALEPQFGFPFAADVVFLQDELFWVNEATHNGERPTSAFEELYHDLDVKVLDIAPGFEVENGQIVSLMERQPVRAAILKHQLSEQIVRANIVEREADPIIDEAISLLERNLSNCRSHMSTFAGDYRIAISFFGVSGGVVMEKLEKSIRLYRSNSVEALNPDLIYRTRCSYLRSALRDPYGHELLFVGSGGIFEYPSREQAARAIHRELIAVVRNQDVSKRGDPSAVRRVVTSAKSMMKRLLGRAEHDLYDLLAWTVFEEDVKKAK